jgi:hypothetical protein
MQKILDSQINDTQFWIDEEDYYAHEQKAWKASLNLPTVNELHKVYPSAQLTVNKLIKDLTKEVRRLDSIKNDVKTIVQKKVSDYRHYNVLLDLYTTLAVEPHYSTTVKRLEELEKIQSNFKYSKAVGSSHTQIKPADVKHVSITKYIEFNSSGKARCLWHEERTPSMQYYPQTNTLKCFGCGKFADIIDVVQEVHKVDFRTALTILKNES